MEKIPIHSVPKSDLYETAILLSIKLIEICEEVDFYEEYDDYYVWKIWLPIFQYFIKGDYFDGFDPNFLSRQSLLIKLIGKAQQYDKPKND